MNSTFKEIKESLLHLLYPSSCIGCGKSSPMSEHVFCLVCKMDLPETELFSQVDNDMEFRLTGRVELLGASALYYFYKSGRIQSAIHDLKYHRNRKVAEVFGREAGKKWLESTRLSTPDFIVPIPLHPKRQYQRGYNQSLVFAQSISKVIDVPVMEVLQKVNHTETQTHKTREDRITSIASSIRVKGNPKLFGKHLLIVDDVLTTGATIEVCAQAIKGYEPTTQFSVCAMALAETI